MASLATVADFANRLNVTFDTGQAAQAQALLDEASGLIRSVTGQTLSQVVGDVISREAPDGVWFDLPQRPVSRVAAVVVQTQTVTDFTVVGARLYRRAGWDNRRTMGSWWPWFPQSEPYLVQVTYDHGYAADDDDYQLAKSACMVTAAQAVANPYGAQRESIDDYQVVFRDGPLELSENLERRLIKQYGRAAHTIRPAVKL